MPATTSGWSGFAARAESTPGVLASSGSPYTLQVFGNGVPNVYGGWRARLQGLSGGNHYRFRARVIAQDTPPARESVTILLRWRGSYGDEVAPDYVWEYRTQPDGSLFYDRTLQAPAGTTAVDVELILQWAPNGRLQFDSLSFVASAPLTARPVKVAAVSYRPSGTKSGLESVQRAEAHGEQVAAANSPDVMVFGELLNVIGAPGTYDAKAESIPGPSTDAMANLARAYRTYVVFGMLERDDRFLYNTAVLLDRSGTIVGKYRKLQLPLAEVSVGITPGADVPVFQTDFGRVALLICQDTAFPEPARQAAIQGAEMLLVPIWGGKPAMTAARAIEQSMYVVASGYDYASDVLDPLGAVVARVASPGQAGAAVSTVDLARRFREKWSGDWRDVSGKERRTYKPLDWTPPTGTDPLPGNTPPTAALTSPSSNASFVAPATITISASAEDSDGTIAQVDFYAGATLLATDSTSPYGMTWNNVPAGSYTLTARVTDNSAAVTTSSPVSITVSAPPPSSLPAPWASLDIGAVAVAGSAAGGDGRFTVQGSGTDIWGTADAFRFVYQPLTGDGTITARVASVQNVNAWTKAGVMVRNGLAAGAAHAFMIQTPTTTKGTAFQRRSTANGTTTNTAGPTVAPPYWVRLVRSGNTITAAVSSNGTTWTAVGTDTIVMGTTINVGLAVTSHAAGSLATATFDNVTVTASP